MDLSDDALLEIVKMLPIHVRSRLLSLHSRFKCIVKKSWLNVKVFPSTRVGFVFPADRDRRRHRVWLEDYFNTLLEFKNITTVRLPNRLKKENYAHEKGWQLGSCCCLIERMIGPNNHVNFILGFVEALAVGKNYLTETTIHSICREEEVYHLERIVSLTPNLKIVRILEFTAFNWYTHRNSSDPGKTTLLLQKLKQIQSSLEKFVIPMSLQKRISSLNHPQ